MPPWLQMKRISRSLYWIFISAFVSVACLSKEESLRTACRPSYVSIPMSKPQSLLIGCRDSLSKLESDHLSLATSYLEPLISTGELDESTLPAINRILTGGKEEPVVNIVIRRHGKWLTIASSAEIGVITISGSEASALMIGSRELLDSLRERDRLSLGKGLDFIVQKYQWDILAHFRDQEVRDRLAEDLAKYVEEKIPELAKSRGGEPAIDLFIYSGRIQESL